jgi:methionine biosynthesis protein MetW
MPRENINQSSSDADELRLVLELLRNRLGPALAGAEHDLTTIQAELAEGTAAFHPGRASRWQDRVIRDAIPPGSSVLDLGCGGGELLAELARSKQVRGQGVERDLDEIAACIAAGVAVVHADIAEGLAGFADGSIDYVVLEETLQALAQPVAVLREMLRVGRIGIVSFPNFAYWRVRLDLLLNGRMPTTRRLPWRWHDTPNIHHLTIADFQDWCAEERVTIARALVRAEGTVRDLRPGDNLHAAEAMFFIGR